MTTYHPIKLMETLRNQIFNSLQGGLFEPIRRDYEGNNVNSAFKSLMEGQAIKVSENLYSGIFSLCNEVMDKLNFYEPIDFYIVGTAEINAESYFSEDPDIPHVIKFNSELLKLLDDEELKYIIGHEIGHLINKDLLVGKLVNFIYEDEESVPDSIIKRLHLYNELAELAADRWGFVATNNLSACVSAIYKLASGLVLPDMESSLESLLELNQQSLDYFLNDDGQSNDTHPVNPIRIKAIEVFAKGKTYKAIDEGMVDLIDIIQTFEFDELTAQRARFMAAAGLWMASANGKRGKLEEDKIINDIADYTLYPMQLIKDVEKEGNIIDVVVDSANYLDNTEDNRAFMMEFLVEVALQDNELSEAELEQIYTFRDHFDYNPAYVAQVFHEKIQDLVDPIGKAFK